MNRIFYHILTVAFMLFGLSSCVDSPDTPTDPTEEPPTRVGRTVLVYMASCNSLGADQYDIADLDEMELAFKIGNVNPDSRLLIYHDDNAGKQSLVEMTAKGRDTLKIYDNTLTAVNVERMQAVFADMKQFSPADAYGLILWSHGSGWLQVGLDEEPLSGTTTDDAQNGSAVAVASPSDVASPQSWGEHRGQTMKITSLARALDGQGFDYVYFDCCYMSSVEVAYEMRHVTPLIAGSAIELPANGMPYDVNLKYLTAPEADVVAAARSTFNHYDSMNASQRTCAMSVIRTAALDRLAEVSRRVYQLSGGVTPSGYRPQYFQVESNCRYFDMGQYYDALIETTGDSELYDQWHQAMDDAIAYCAATPMIWNRLAINSHSGLSTYILRSTTDPSIKGYNTLSWWKDVIKSDS